MALLATISRTICRSNPRDFLRGYIRREPKRKANDERECDILPNPEGEKEIYTLRKNGRWYKQVQAMHGGSLVLGRRRYYQDPHFKFQKWLRIDILRLRAEAARTASGRQGTTPKRQKLVAEALGVQIAKTVAVLLKHDSRTNAWGARSKD